MIKKKLFLGFIVIMVCMLALVACGSEEQAGSETNPSDDDQEASEVSGVIPSYVPRSGGAIYLTSAGISKIFSDEGLMPNVQLSVEAAGGSPGNIEAVLDKYEKGEPAIGSVSSRDGTEAYEGEYEYVPGEHKELRAVGFVNAAHIHLVVPADSDIQTFSDLKGKDIGAPPGAAIEDTIREVLSTLGLEDGEDYNFQPYNNGEVKQAMQDGSLDAGSLTGLVPSSDVKETISLTDIRILSLSEEETEKYLNEYAPYAAVQTIEAGTYDGIDEDLTVPVINSQYITHKDTPDELIYNYMKAMMEYPDQLQSIVPGADINEDNILEGIEMPLHPASEKYLQDIGVLE